MMFITWCAPGKAMMLESFSAESVGALVNRAQVLTGDIHTLQDQLSRFDGYTEVYFKRRENLKVMVEEYNSLAHAIGVSVLGLGFQFDEDDLPF